MDNQIIVIQESKSFSDFRKYIGILVRERLFIWIWYVTLITVLGGKHTQFVVIKNNDQVIGGFFITDIPLAKYKSYNLGNKEAQLKINELVRDGYKYFCSFIVKKQFRNKGVGSMVFETYLQKRDGLKIWFTSSKKAVPFYFRHGARVFYRSKRTIYTFCSNNNLGE